MLLRRTVLALPRRAAFTPISRRAFTSSRIQREERKADTVGDIKRDPEKAKTKQIVDIPGQTDDMIPFEEVQGPHDLRAPGAAPGTVPTDIEQATGLERLEILGKMQGIDIFDMKPLDASRLGTLDDPIMVKSAGDEQYCGCTGFPADSHTVLWITLSRTHPRNRCKECGSVYKMEYIGPPDDPHDDHHHGWQEAKNWSDFVRPEYRCGR
ncbi:MAG: hypothetical protein Q9219_000640 [cf. Caloplaca sp. 3 TL-2023]